MSAPVFSAARRLVRAYGGIAALTPKLFLAYSAWVWMEFFVQILAMTIFAYFWRAVYAGGTAIGGLTLQQTLNYILLAQLLVPLVETRLIFDFGFLLRQGQLAVELLRPVDFQAHRYVEALTGLLLWLILKTPLLIVATLAFGLQLPADPVLWLTFLLALVLGHGALFFFDWAFACLAFYSTETWGLSVVRVAVATFFSGALVPLTLMPDWLQALAGALPFAQAVYVPVALLSGIEPLSAAPRLLLVQAAWLGGLLVLARVVFNFAVRKITVQGG